MSTRDTQKRGGVGRAIGEANMRRCRHGNRRPSWQIVFGFRLFSRTYVCRRGVMTGVYDKYDMLIRRDLTVVRGPETNNRRARYAPRDLGPLCK